MALVILKGYNYWIPPKTHPLVVRFPVYENQKSHFGNGIYIKSGRTYAHALFHAINITLKHYTCYWGVPGCFQAIKECDYYTTNECADFHV